MSGVFFADAIAATLAVAVTFPFATVPPEIAARVVASLHQTRALDDSLELARQRSAEAVACLGALRPSRAARALATVAEAIVDRDL